MTYLSGHLSVGFMQPGPGVQRRGGDSRIVVMFEVGNLTPYEPRIIRE